MTLISFEDAVTASNLNPDQLYAVFYCDGIYANEAAVRARCPRAKLFAITVFGKTGNGIFACDCETGDLTVAQAIAWVEEQIKLGVELICVYADLDRWENQGLKVALAHYGSRIKRWVADYDDSAVIPGGYDAKQYEGGITSGVDQDVALATFFEGVTPVHHPVVIAPTFNIHPPKPVRKKIVAAVKKVVAAVNRRGRWAIAQLKHRGAPLGGLRK